MCRQRVRLRSTLVAACQWMLWGQHWLGRPGRRERLRVDPKGGSEPLRGVPANAAETPPMSYMETHQLG